MWRNRLLIGISAAAICASTSLSVGSGRAAALPFPEILAAAKELAAPVAETWRLGPFKNDVESLIVTQGTKLTPVQDEVGLTLTKFKSELRQSAPREPLPNEVVPVRGEVPSPYRQAKEMLCGTALDLLASPDKLSWKYLINQVDNQVIQQNPLGKKLILYSELNEIADNFENGCYCAATAELAVFFAKKAYCEGTVV